jgi:formylglycine-generating enzyme required for sulfatase activity
MPSTLLKTLLLLASVCVGCRQAAHLGNEIDDYQQLVELEKVTNLYSLESGTESSAIKPGTMIANVEGIVLPDLGLTFREVIFNMPIDGHPAVWFSDTEVTNEMYSIYLVHTKQMRDDSRVEEASQSRFSSTASPVIHISDKSALWRDGAIPPERKDHPVSLVTVGQAIAFCEWLNVRYRPTGLFRLPSEAEWLMAAYGVDRKYPWGDEQKEWTGTTTEPVRARPALMTPDGLYGMWGNVSELVLSPSDGYGGTIDDIYTPFITKWQGASYQDKLVRGVPVQPRQDYWCYTHSVKSRSDEWGFRVVFVSSDSP